MNQINKESNAIFHSTIDSLKISFIAFLIFFLLIEKKDYSEEREPQVEAVSNDQVKIIRKPLVNLIIREDGAYELRTSGSNANLNRTLGSFRSMINVLEKEKLQGVIISTSGNMLYRTVKEIKVKLTKEIPNTTVVLN